jgi:hypothetical protein
VQGEDALEHAEREHGEQNGGRGDPESWRSQHSSVGREVAPGCWLADQEDERDRRQQQREVGQEGAADAAEGPQRRSDQSADRIGGEDAAHAGYSWPGQRSRVSKVTPIQMPADPRPIRKRAAK